MRHRNRTWPALGSTLSCAIVMVAVAGSAQAEGDAKRTLPTFSSTVDVVNLNVSVSDGRDRHITGLAAGDFKILEDGVPQQLCLFTQERLPISVLQDFTNDQAQLEAAVRGISAEGATGVYNALYFTLKDPRFRSKKDEMTRQAVVVLSDGEDTSSLVSDDQVLQLAKKGNVTIFAISLRPTRTSTFDTEAPDRAAFFLTALARETGGRSYFPNGLAQIDGVYDKIADELRTQYALGYVSSNPVRDGKWRRIAIETAKGNLMLRHKQGYYAGALRALRSAVGAATSAATGAASTLPRRPPAPQN
jgi:Ca-activated chloride channel family protein